MSAYLWLRADASTSIGLGHLMRLVALAERAGGVGLEPRFVVGGSRSMCALVEGRGFTSTFVKGDSSEWLDAIAPEDVVVFDGYHFEVEILQAAGKRAARVGALDDFEGGSFPVDVLVNQNPVADPRYSINEGGSVLVGPKYALVRREFLAHRRDRGGDQPRTLLVTMGGSDVLGLTQTLIDRFGEQDAFERLLVVVGPGAELHKDPPPLNVDVIRSPADVAATFASADAAISAAGGTTWELLAIGMPTALVQVTDNQRHIGPGVARLGAGVFIGQANELAPRAWGTVEQLADQAVRSRLSSNALRLVDGSGARRVLDHLVRQVTSGTR